MHKVMSRPPQTPPQPATSYVSINGGQGLWGVDPYQAIQETYWRAAVTMVSFFGTLSE